MQTHYVTTITMYYTDPDADISGEYKRIPKPDGTDEYIKLESRRGPKDVSRTLLQITTNNVDIQAITRTLNKGNK